MSDIALIATYYCYMGDHTEKLTKVVRVPLTCTVAELLEIGKQFSGFECIEVKAEKELTK